MDKKLLDEYFAKYEDLEKLQDSLRLALDNVKDLHGAELATVKDSTDEDKTIEVAERALWNEVYHLGRKGHRASDYLSEKYPDIFKQFDDEEHALNDIIKFEQKHFGFDHRHLTMPNQIKLWELFLDYKMGSYAKKKKRKES